MRSFCAKISNGIGRKCHSLELSALDNGFSTGTARCLWRQIPAQRRTDLTPDHRFSAPGSKTQRTLLLALLAAALFCPGAHAQLPPLNAPPSWGQVPQGTGACAIGKSCADLAPGMMRDAFGSSPLDAEVRTLSKILSSPSGRTEAGAAAWAIAAFRRAGADSVHAEPFGSSGQLKNVVAEIRGREFPNDFVLLLAPLDPSEKRSLATAENVAVLIDAVRVIHATGNIPRRSIRVVLFAAEGPALGGSAAGVWAYIQQHRGEMDRMAAAVILPRAAQSPDGYALGGRPDTLASVRQALEPLRPLGVRNFTEVLKFPTAATPFWLEGVPTLVAISTESSDADKPAGGDSVQSATDPMKLQRLKRSVAVVAVTAYALADAESRIGPRLSLAQVEQSIRTMGLAPRLKNAGLLDQWRKTQAEATPKPPKSSTKPK